MAEKFWESAPVVTPERSIEPMFTIPDAAGARDEARDQTRTDIAVEGNERDAGRFAREGDKDARQGMADVRKEYYAYPIVKAYQEAATALDTGLFTKPDGSGDGTLLYQYSKLMDPMGSVREGDVELAKSGAGYLNAKAAEIKKNFNIGSGGSLPDDIRQGLRREMISRFNSLNRAYNQQRQQSREIAIALGYDPALIIGKHAGTPFLERFRQYDRANGIGEFAPERRKPVSPDDLAFDMDTGTGAFGSKIEGLRLRPENEAAWAAFLQSSAGDPSFSEEKANRFLASLGEEGGLSLDPEFIKAVREGGNIPTGIDYSQADEARRAEMGALAKERYGDDPTTRASLLLKGGLLNWSDEAAGALGGIADTLSGGSFADGYQRERDLERYVQEESQDKYGLGWEIGGSFAAPLSLMKAPKTLADFGKAGAKVGAIAGAGEGEGVPGTLGGAGIGATLGYGTGVGGKKLLDVAAPAAQKVSGALARNANPARQEFADAANRQGLDYLAADIPGSKLTQFATSVAKATLGGVPLSEAAGKIADKAKAVRARIAGDVGEAGDNVTAGQAAQRGMEAWERKTTGRGGELYDAIPIKPDAMVDLSTTRATLADLNNAISSNAELAGLVRDPRMTAYQQALEKGDLSWRDIKAFRSYIGEKAGRPTLQQDTSKDSLDALYGALSSDIERAAQAHSPEAAKAFARANNYWRGRQQRLGEVMTKLVGKGGDMTPEATFDQMERWARAKGGDFMSLSRAIRSMPDEDANAVRATIIDRLGDANPGAQNAANDSFSPDVFLTQWAKMSDRAKAVLFQGDHRKALDDMATVIEGSKFARGFDNNSRTGLINTAIAGGAVALADPVSALALTALQYGGGKLLASPRFAKWMAALGRKPNPSAQLAHVKQLEGIARAEPTIANDIFALQDRLASAFAQPSALRSAAEEGDELRKPPPAQGERDDAQ